MGARTRRGRHRSEIRRKTSDPPRETDRSGERQPPTHLHRQYWRSSPQGAIRRKAPRRLDRSFDSQSAQDLFEGLAGFDLAQLFRLRDRQRRFKPKVINPRLMVNRREKTEGVPFTIT